MLIIGAGLFEGAGLFAGAGFAVCIGAVALLVAIALGVYLFGIYNGFVELKNNIDRAWANIDVLLKQRYDELPNIVNSVKGYMKHEKGVLESVTAARTAFLNAQTIGEKAAADAGMTGALKTLFAVAESYPQLKANENFLQLQSRISALENEIADRREFYNNSVMLLNARIQMIPDKIVAGIMGLKEREYFKVAEAEKQTVKVSFEEEEEEKPKKKKKQ
ncbi:LemA family protein [Candidatus Micrarchaeota archaeon]|nr:LemA family protein [Candidatus Micrarchaeota archaeon]